MPKFIIEREMPGVGRSTAFELQGASKQSCSAISKIGPQIQWIESYVTDNKVYSVYIAPDEQTLRRHAYKAGLPVNRVSRIRAMTDPTTAESESAPPDDCRCDRSESGV